MWPLAGGGGGCGPPRGGHRLRPARAAGCGESPTSAGRPSRSCPVHPGASLCIRVSHTPAPPDFCLGLATARQPQGPGAAGASWSFPLLSQPWPLWTPPPSPGTFSVPWSHQAPCWCLSQGARHPLSDSPAPVNRPIVNSPQSPSEDAISSCRHRDRNRQEGWDVDSLACVSSGSRGSRAPRPSCRPGVSASRAPPCARPARTPRQPYLFIEQHASTASACV